MKRQAVQKISEPSTQDIRGVSFAALPQLALAGPSLITSFNAGTIMSKQCFLCSKLCAVDLVNHLTSWRVLPSWGALGCDLFLHAPSSPEAHYTWPGPVGTSCTSCIPTLPLSLSCTHVCISIIRRGRTSQQYVTGVIITSQTPIMPSAADLSPFLPFNHPLASLTLTEQQHRPCDLSAGGHDL